MRPPRNRWPSTASSEGTLFFAQAMAAFLDDQSYEGFRAYSLDTLARLREAYAVAEDVKLNRVPKAALRPVVDELLWSLAGDDAATEIAKEQIEFVITQLSTAIPEADRLQSLAAMLIDCIAPRYREAIRDKVIEVIPNSSKRIDLLKATGFLVSHLINSGHSRVFLLQKVEEKFFSQAVGRAGASVVKSFIDGISEENRRYNVVCAVKSDTANILERMAEFQIMELRQLPPHARIAIMKWASFQQSDRYVLESISAADRHRAVAQLHDRLAGIRSLMVLQSQRPNLNWSERFYAYSPRGTTGETIERSEANLQPVSTANLAGRRLLQVTRVPRQFETDFDDLSRERLFSAVSTAAVAIETNLAETRLISLWSAFEVLLSDPPSGDARVVHYIKHLSPCISIKYHRRLFSAVHDQLSVMYRKKFKSIINQVEGSPQDQHTNFAMIVVLPKYRQQQQDLINLCSNSPLARHRLFRLQKYYGTPHAAVTTMVDHEKRVAWQLNRIYRARNNLVHAGKTPLFIDSLVLNALEYFRSSVLTIARKAKSGSERQKIDQVVAEIGFDWSMKIALLNGIKKGEPFSDELALRVFGAK